jgi:hypothetical protein
VGADVVGNLLGLVDGLLVVGLTVGVDVMGDLLGLSVRKALELSVGVDVMSNLLGLADGLAVVGLSVVGLSVEVDVGY